MMFVAEAFAGWLVGQVADAARMRMSTWLFGSDQERALQQAATAAIQATARKFRPGPTAPDDPQGAEHLARVIDQVFQNAPTPAESPLTEYTTLLQGLQAGVVARLAVLADASITGTGQSSAELLGVSVPAVTDVLMSQLLREIVVLGARGGPLTPLASQLNHDVTHLQGHHTNTTLEQLVTDQKSMLAILDRLDQQTRSIPARKTQPLGRSINELTDPFALEVHRAIDAPVGTALLPALPAYVQRAHDRRLHAIVEQATEGHSVAAVLVGGSSTGKTRACWEAVQALPRDWRLWHPIDPSRPEAAAEALPLVGPRTVIWLNEAQHYLLTSPGQLGERVAAGLRELLRDPERGPVLVLGTIWPEHWATLTNPSRSNQQDDPHAQARMLLTGTDIPVPDAFTGPDLQEVHAAAKTDPRLAEAAKHAEDSQITQFLAGAPALLERYRNAPAAAKALIEAAMDTRRLGHGVFLPQGLLEEAAAHGYLTDEQWNALGEDWLKEALAYCAESSRGPTGPLTRVRPRPGETTPAQSHYRLADYLEQTGRVLRRGVLAPAGLWDALVEHADERDLMPIAKEAERRGLYRHAFRLYRRAADAGHPDGLWKAAWLLLGADRGDEAISLYEEDAQSGDPIALRHTARLLELVGRGEEAMELYQRAAEGGDPVALWQCARSLSEAGQINAAMELYQRAAESGDPHAVGPWAQSLAWAGRIDEALDLFQRAAEGGDPHALGQAAGVLRRAGRIDEAIDQYQRAAESGDPHALGQAAELLEEAGRIDEAIDQYQRAAERGDSFAPRRAVALLREPGHIDEAVRLYQRAAEGGDPSAQRETAWRLEQAGHINQAIDLYQRAAERGDSSGLSPAGELLERAGRIEEAIDLYQQAADNGDTIAQWQTAALLAQVGRIDEAIDNYQRLGDNGRPHALWQAAKLLERADRIDEAIDNYQQAADNGDFDAPEHAARLLRQTGRIEEAISLLRTCAASAGNRQAMRNAVEILQQAGRLGEAAQLRQFGLEPDSQIANEWH